MLIALNHPWPYLATAAFVALLGFYAWSQPHRPGNRYFFWIVSVWLVWALAAGFATVVQTPVLRYVIWALQVFCVLLAAPLELMFSLKYTGNEKWLNRRSMFLLIFPGLLFGLLSITLPRSYLVSTEIRSGVGMFVTNMLVKWSFFAASFTIWLISLGLLFGSLLRSPAFRAPIALIILGQSIPRIAFVINPLQSTVTPMQIAILFSNFTALAYIVGLYNFRLLRVIPVARDKVIDHMPYAMLVLDAENNLIDFNPAAWALPGLPSELARRQTPDRALGEWWDRISPLIGPGPVAQDVVVQTVAGERYFHVLGLPLLQASGWRIGEVFVLQDETQAKHAHRLQTQTLWAQAAQLEREQLADELHDSIYQSLAFLNLQAQIAQIHLQAGESQAVLASLARLTEAAGLAQEGIRKTIRNLLSVSLPAEDFFTMMGRILSGFEQQTGLAARLEMDGDSHAETAEFFYSTRLPPPVAVQLVRITQEALANVRKHARGASQVRVQLKASEGQVFLGITDDGPGFVAATQRSDGKHFGLHIMRQRAARLGGTFEICPAPGKGTRIEVRIPLPNGETRSSE